MASPAGIHPGAAGGREVVFCHACQHEWYRDERDSLECPRCQSSFTEIVEASNDPRGMPGVPGASIFSGASTPHYHQPGGSDSDPEEDDIEEQLRGHFGSPRPNPAPRHGAQNDRDGGNGNEGDAIFRRFTDMLINDFGAGRAMRGGPAHGGLFPPGGHDLPPGARIRQATFSPFGGSARVTVTSGTFGGGAQGQPNLNTLFDQLFGNPFAPVGEDPNRADRGAAEPGVAFAGPFAGGLQGLLATLYNPEAAVHGDSVYSQAAFDRIISQLMEQSASNNAAPPASQTAIENLEKKRVDDEMLGPEGKAECTICIDEISKGDEVSVLPCKHWYHGECVVLWLKEHNTCPICRKPIESGSNRQQPQQPGSSQASASTSASASARRAPINLPLPPISTYNPFSHPQPEPRPERERERPMRSARENFERLNAIRNLASGGAESSQRRSSHSPPGARQDADDGSRSRTRSPSFSRDRDRRSDGERRGEWEWNEYTRGSGSGGGGGGGGWFGDAGGWGRNDLHQNQQQQHGQHGQHQHQHQHGQRSQQQNQQQQHHQGLGGGGPFGWLRDHFARRG